MLKSIVLGTLLTMIAAATDYHVGPGQPLTQIGQVPWYGMQPGDTVYIHYQPTPYHEKFLISGRGTPSQWIRVLGVPGPNGELPIISGANATTSTNMHYHWQTLNGNGIQWDGVVQIAVRADDPVLGPAPLPGYIEVANLQVQDGNPTNTFTGENGSTANYDIFSSCIYARSAQHILIRNNVMTNCGLGFYNWTGAGSNWWDGTEIDTTLRANYFYNNGVVNNYSEHQSYTESLGVVIEYNHYGPAKAGMMGTQLKDRSAGSVIRYNYIEPSAAGWWLDMVEPENGWGALGTSPTYAQDFVYGNIFHNNTTINNNPAIFHWNEDHDLGIGRATVTGGRLHFYDNTFLNIGDLTDMWQFTLFNVNAGGFTCPTSALPGVIELRNNIFAALPRTSGSSIPPMQLGYCGEENFDLGVNWISPGWVYWRNTNTGTVTGASNMFVPAINDPGFLSIPTDLHLTPGSSAIGIGQALPAAISSNALGADFTPTQQYVYNTQVTARPSNGGVGSAAGAFDATTVSGCTYTVSPPSNSYGAGASTGTISVTTGSTCAWTASTLTSWLTITSVASGTGNGLVNYSVAANNTTSSRSGSLTIAGNTVPITQAGIPCQYSLSATSASLAAAGGTGSVNVTAPTGCTWTAVSNASWVTVTGGASGSGNGTVSYSAAANTSTTALSGTVTIAGQTFTVSEAAAPCSFTISPSSASMPATGGTGSVSVTAPTGCTWTVVSNASWVTVTGGASGSGNGTVSYSAAANTSTTALSGTVTIAGQTFTLSEAAAAPTCSYTISPSSASMPATGGTGSVSVTAPTGCTWTAVSKASWVTVTGGASGSGNGTVSYSAAANTSTTALSGTVTIAGQTFTVSEAAAAPTCSYTISPSIASATAGGGTGSVSVTAPAGCTWTAVSTASWVTVTGGASGSGNGTVSYSVAANGTTVSRSGTMTIAGKTFTISQPVVITCSFTVSPTSLTVVAAGGAASLTMTAPAGCAWTATTTTSWITITSGASGSGNGTIGLSIASLGTGPTRSGTVTAGANTITVTQNAAATTTTASFRYGVNGYTGAADRTISSLYADQSYNRGQGLTDPDGTTLYLKNDSAYESRPLLRFSNLNIPAGATVVSATLTVTFTNWQSLPFTVNGYYLATPWNATAQQAGINWADHDVSAPWAQPGAKGVGTDVIANKTFAMTGFQAIGNQAKTITLDTAVVQGWLDNPASNQGVVLALNSQATQCYMTAFSAEAGTASQRPVLTITYK